jgi:hypothetical protein
VIALHPSLQRQLGAYLLEAPAQFLVITHSAELLPLDDAADVQLDRDDKNATQERAVDEACRRKVPQKLRAKGNERLPFAWRAILCEGQDDVEAIMTLSELGLPLITRRRTGITQKDTRKLLSQAPAQRRPGIHLMTRSAVMRRRHQARTSSSERMGLLLQTHLGHQPLPTVASSSCALKWHPSTGDGQVQAGARGHTSCQSRRISSGSRSSIWPPAARKMPSRTASLSPGTRAVISCRVQSGASF